MGCLVLLLILVGLPVAEFAVMSRVAESIGWLDTIFLLILSAVFGTYMARHQGARVLARIQQCMAEGRLPTLEMIDGLLVFIGGALFVLPGFISDAVGLLLIFPLTRWVIRLVVVSGFKARAMGPRSEPQGDLRQGPRQDKPRPTGIDRGQVVDAEVVE